MYDFVDDPTAEGFGQGYNGSLSLRNTALILDVLAEADFGSDNAQLGCGPGAEFEDQWYYQRMRNKEPGCRRIMWPRPLPSKPSTMSIHWDTISQRGGRKTKWKRSRSGVAEVGYIAKSHLGN